mmetsp:Transcript_15989/g.45363  ORF Transcript_15989/g.45363 Transcript_15989/m.45363 type:complete len:273 (+) Transcript_15989:391-1209(+)
MERSDRRDAALTRARPPHNGLVAALCVGDDLHDLTFVARLVVLLAVGMISHARPHPKTVADPDVAEQAQGVACLRVHASWPLRPELVLGLRLLRGPDEQGGLLLRPPVAGSHERRRGCEGSAGGVGPHEVAVDGELPDRVVRAQVDAHLVVDERGADRDAVVDAVRVVPTPRDVVGQVGGADVSGTVRRTWIPHVEAVLAGDLPDPLGAVSRDAGLAHHADLDLRAILLLVSSGLPATPALLSKLLVQHQDSARMNDHAKLGRGAEASCRHR